MFELTKLVLIMLPMASNVVYATLSNSGSQTSSTRTYFLE